MRPAPDAIVPGSTLPMPVPTHPSNPGNPGFAPPAVPGGMGVSHFVNGQQQK